MKVYFPRTSEALTRVAPGVRYVPAPEVHPLDYPWLARSLEAANEDIATTNAYLLDLFDVEAVTVIDAGGRTARLIDHPEWARWGKVMHGGEFASMVGHDWIEKLEATKC